MEFVLCWIGLVVRAMGHPGLTMEIIWKGLSGAANLKSEAQGESQRIWQICEISDQRPSVPAMVNQWSRGVPGIALLMG